MSYDEPEEVKNSEEEVNYEMASTEQKLEGASTKETWDLMVPCLTGGFKTPTEGEDIPEGWICSSFDLYSDPLEGDRDHHKCYRQFFSNGVDLSDNELEEMKKQLEKKQKLKEQAEEEVDYEMASTEQKSKDAFTKEIRDLKVPCLPGGLKIVMEDDSTKPTWDILLDHYYTRGIITLKEENCYGHGWRGCSRMIMGMMSVPIDVDETVYELAELAIGTYNQQEGTNYKLVRVTKATGYGCKGFVYTITFKAEDTADIINIFRACIHRNFDSSINVYECDIHPKPEPGTSSSKAKKGCISCMKEGGTFTLK